MPYKNPMSEQARESKRNALKRWRERNPEKQKAIYARYHLRHRDERNKECRKRNKKLSQKKRLQVLIHYGGSPPKCVCCGENYIEFLTIDHIHGNGNKQRKLVTGITFYTWLIKNNFPEGYRVLCYNCNCSLGHYGHCPHENQLDIKIPYVEFLDIITQLPNIINHFRIEYESVPAGTARLRHDKALEALKKIYLLLLDKNPHGPK